MYKIYPFILTNYDDMSIIQNTCSTVILKDKFLIEYMNYIDTNEIYEISKEDIESFFINQDSKDVLNFMIDNCIISEVKEPKINFKNIEIISNDTVFLHSIDFNAKGLDFEFKCSDLPKNLNDIVVKENTLYIIFLNPFNISLYTQISDIFHSNNVIYRMAFYYNNYIYLSNYHKKEWVNPCPICFYTSVISSLKAKYNSSKSVSFQSLLQIIYKRHPEFNVENKFNNYTIKDLVSLILDQLKIINSFSINKTYNIDILNNIISEDESEHWELCDCYE